MALERTACELVVRQRSQSMGKDNWRDSGVQLLRTYAHDYGTDLLGGEPVCSEHARDVGYSAAPEMRLRSLTEGKIPVEIGS
jgi:hypothetical protein